MKGLLATLFITTGLLSTNILAETYTHGDLSIDSPYTRTTPPSAPVAGGFMKITNNGKEADTLIGGRVDFSEVVEIHEMPMIDGVMHMRQLENGLEIPPGETVELKPGSFHVMFIKLKEQMKEGDKHKATLTFEKAGDVEVELEVRDINKGMGQGMQHGKMGQGAGMQQGKMAQGMGMKHEKRVSEMPDLMKVIMQHGDKLNLSSEQQDELKKWRDANNSKVSGLAEEAAAAKQKIMEMALGDADNDQLAAQYEKIATARKAIIDTKIACRANMQRVLNAEQYQQLIALYKENFIPKQQNAMQ
ncbi:MAG: copper chaperone PCu(A)C [Thiolinea sp.]